MVGFSPIRTILLLFGVVSLTGMRNVAEGQRWNAALARQIFDRYLALTAEGVTQAAGRTVTVWPETASPYLLQTDPGARAAILQATGGQPALVGSIRFDAADQPRNSLIAVTDPGPPAAMYDKWHLVPFGEYIPAWLPIPVKFGLPASFAAGSGPQTLHLADLPAVGALICYEAIFPSQIVDRADRPAWLVNITNDAWFGDSTGPRQHLAAVRMRAIEEGLPVLRAANTGISAAFDAHGRELGRLDIGRTGFLTIKLPGALPPTWFAHYGLLTPLALAVVAIVAGLWRVRLQP